MKPNDLRRLIEAATKNGERDWYVEAKNLRGLIRLNCYDNDGSTCQIEEELGEGGCGDYQLALYELIAALLNAAPDILALMEAAEKFVDSDTGQCKDLYAAVRRMRGE